LNSQIETVRYGCRFLFLLINTVVKIKKITIHPPQTPITVTFDIGELDTEICGSLVEIVDLSLFVSCVLFSLSKIKQHNYIKCSKCKNFREFWPNS